MGLPGNIFLVSIMYLINIHCQRIIKKKKDGFLPLHGYLNCVGWDEN